MRPIRHALVVGAVATLVASCGASPQPRSAEVGGAPHQAARYRTLQTADLCTCDAAFATAEGPGIGTTTRIYRTAFSVVDDDGGDQAQLQVAIYDLTRTPTDLSLYGNNVADVTITGPTVSITSVLQRSAGQDPRASIAVIITLDANGVLDLAIDNVATFTGAALPFGVVPGSCQLPPFLAIPEPPDDTM